MNEINIIIADDHVMMREGLKSLIENDLKYKVIGETGSGIETIKMAESLFPDIIIMDISMPDMDGIQATAIIKDRDPKIKIIILSMHNNSTFVKKALKYGAEGFVLKDSAFDDLATAIEAVKNSSYYLSYPLIGTIIESYVESYVNNETEELYNTLSAREKEIFYFTVRGHSRKSISEFLCISLNTVDQHRRNVKAKLKCEKHEELINIAILLNFL